MSDFNFAFALLQIPLGIIGVPLGIVVLPTLSREAAVGRESAFAVLLTRALRLLVYVMVPIAVLTAVVRQPVVEILFGGGKIDQADLDLIAITLVGFVIGLTAHALIAVLARAFYARQDTVTPVAAAVGAVVVNCTLAVILVGPLGPARDRRSPSPSRPGSKRWPCWRSSTTGCRTSSSAASAGSASRRSPAAWWPGWRRPWSWPASTARSAGERGRVLSIVIVAVVSVAFGAVYAGVSVALRIPELPSIVGVMADVLRRPIRS